MKPYYKVLPIFLIVINRFVSIKGNRNTKINSGLIELKLTVFVGVFFPSHFIMTFIYLF